MCTSIQYLGRVSPEDRETPKPGRGGPLKPQFFRGLVRVWTLVQEGIPNRKPRNDHGGPPYRFFQRPAIPSPLSCRRPTQLARCRPRCSLAHLRARPRPCWQHKHALMLPWRTERGGQGRYVGGCVPLPPMAQVGPPRQRQLRRRRRRRRRRQTPRWRSSWKTSQRRMETGYWRTEN